MDNRTREEVIANEDRLIEEKERYRKLKERYQLEKEIYKTRNEKAIEYIKQAQTYGTLAQVMPHLTSYVNGDDLLEILKGEDK